MRERLIVEMENHGKSARAVALSGVRRTSLYEFQRNYMMKSYTGWTKGHNKKRETKKRSGKNFTGPVLGNINADCSDVILICKAYNEIHGT
jgi:hypothetical protein